MRPIKAEDTVKIEKFPVGSKVPIADTPLLLEFQRTWKYHHKLAPEQLAYACNTAVVEKVGFFHGGDVLYEPKGVPGVWHEQVLLATNDA